MGGTLAWGILACLPGLAQVQVAPAEVVLGAGQRCAFQATLARAPGADPSRPPSWARGEREPDLWLWTLSEGGPGHLDGRGVYTAPAGGPAERTRIRATLAASPEVWGEATVTLIPLPDVPVALVGQVLGPDWAAPYSTFLPFVEGDVRWRPRPGVVARTSLWAHPLEVGYGLPAQLTWTFRPGAAGARLTYREGSQTVRRDVSGQDRALLTLRGWTRRCRVESLLPAGGGTWISCVETRRLLPRGLFPLPEDGEGPGLAARCAEPSGLLEVHLGPRPSVLVADAGGHALHVLDPDRKARTWCGDPGQPGHRDSPPPKGCLRRVVESLAGLREPPPRFNRPTFLAQGMGWGWGASWRVMVADSGNHVVRTVTPVGRVGTLAGTAGHPGHLDAVDPLEARFNTPQGLAWDPWDQSLYVADQGNAVVRKVHRLHGVTTVAGQVGNTGSRDGGRQVAQFTNLKGLQRTPRPMGPARLYVLDGHAVREVNPGTGQVTTVLGQVDAPGFRDIGPGPEPPLAPCLNDPWDLKPCGRAFLIADRGNHAVRLWDAARGSLTTLAGDPALPVTRSGLLRDGMAVPLDGTYGALRGPRALLPLSPGHVLVATEPSVVSLGQGDPAREPAWTLLLECAVEPRGGTCQARFTLVGDQEEVVPMAYTVDFLEPDGTLAGRRTGDSFTWQPILADGIFGQQGKGRVVVRCVTHQGRSAGGMVEVEIR
ncbi:NHL repeat-containing protein [Mesoterricola silvestris]|uniref:NHL repeat containing protein n=1 Tax=Mesoterricola silvestris TaxID=2927979 RepID=A0AA48GNP5_9BACT|nr:hypothetical protein [Mesoterricola silvestris]BDU74757.1 hypothetical protein METEAL_39310 [Mesoterricola silvestris]